MTSIEEKTLVLQKNVKYVIKKINSKYPYILPYYSSFEEISKFSNDNYIYNKFNFFTSRENFLKFSDSVKKDLTKCNNFKLLTGNVHVSLITTWSIGTGHGYSQLYDILINLKKTYKNFQDEKYKFLVYKNSQKGIKEIISYFIPSNRIIYLDHEVIYKIDNFLHLNGDKRNLMDNIDHRFHNSLIPFFEENYYSKFDISKPIYKKICIIKHDKSLSISDNRSFNFLKIKEFCKLNDYYMVDHLTMSMPEIIYLINNCQELLLSWGTSFFNHYIYISDKCKVINNFILENSSYHLREYKNMGEYYKTNLNRLRNADIKYYVVDKDLLNNPLIKDKEHLRSLPCISLYNIESNTFACYDFIKGLWNSNISITKDNKIIKESNHFFELSFREDYVANVQQHNGNYLGFKNHLIYHRIAKNYELLKKNNDYKIIEDKCVFLSTSFSSANAGHDICCIFSILQKFIKNYNIKFVIFEEHINTNNYKIIRLFLNIDRLIIIKGNNFYNFKRQISFTEIPTHNVNDYKELIFHTREKIINYVENNYVTDKLKNKKVIIIKNSKNYIVNTGNSFGDATNLFDFLISKNWVIIDPENDDFYRFTYMLMKSNTIITSFQGGISCANQIFYNINSAKIIVCRPYNRIIFSKKREDMFIEDIFCNGFYNNHIYGYLTIPPSIKHNELKELITVMENNSIL